MAYQHIRGRLARASVLAFASAFAVFTGAVNSRLIARAQEINPQTVVYGEVGSEKLMLDIYPPQTGDAPHAAVVLIHGGAGSFGGRSDLRDHAEALATAGYVAFSIDYRLFRRSDGSNRWPAQFDDAQLAVRWVRANAARYDVDPQRICAFGHSFGGQLAALLGMRDTSNGGDLALAAHSSRAACVIDVAGSNDANQPLLDASTEQLRIALMGGTASDLPDRYRDASPLAQGGAATAPFLIFHGANDDKVSVEQSRRLVDSLHTAGVTVMYVEYPNALHLDWVNHSRGGGWDLVGPETLAFLERQLHPQAEG